MSRRNGDYREVKPDTRKRLIAAHVSLGEYRESGRSGRGCSKNTVEALLRLLR